MRAKKGMSPLIATVLLIAFAVALGAMIMNWSTDIQPVEDDSRGVDATNNPCTDVSFELKEVFGKQLFCYQDGKIRFNVENDGFREISGVQLRTIDENLAEVTSDLVGSKLPIGGTFDHQVAFNKDGKVHVELVPYVISGGTKQYCTKKKIVKDILPACE